MTIRADFSEDRMYRFEWETYVSMMGEGRVTFLMLNPSTADEKKPDPTIRRCIRFARAFGFQWLNVVNCYPLRSTDPDALVGHTEPTWVTERNEATVAAVAAKSEMMVAAYGAHPQANYRGPRLMEIAAKAGCSVYVLGWTEGGFPKHPLYVPNATEVQRFI